MQQLLKFSPFERISASQALKHAYLHSFHDDFVEREAPCGVKVCIPDEERRSTNQYRERLYKEVAEFRKAEGGGNGGGRGGLSSQRPSYRR